MKEYNYQIDNIIAAARWLLSQRTGRSVVLFDAPMGAGKTTLISTIARELGSSDEANSPTFSIINEYGLPNHQAIYHFDLYRLDDPAAVADIGIGDYLDSGNLCLIEWPKVALPFLPQDSMVVRIIVNTDSSRTLQILN